MAGKTLNAEYSALAIKIMTETTETILFVFSISKSLALSMSAPSISNFPSEPIEESSIPWASSDRRV
jgi:hypothetical protein